MARSPTDTTKFLTLDELGRLFTALDSPGMAAGDTTVGNGPNPQDAVAALSGGQLALSVLISIASFTIGGYIVGLKSPGGPSSSPASRPLLP